MAEGASAAAIVSLQRAEDHDHLIFSVRRTSDDQTVSFGLPMPEAKFRELKARLPNILNQFRQLVGDPNVKLSDDRASQASLLLKTAAWAILDLLCEGSGVSPGEFVSQIRVHLQPLFGSASLLNKVAPV